MIPAGIPRILPKVQTSISTSENCPGCWDSKCAHTVCGICGGHGHTDQEHAGLAAEVCGPDPEVSRAQARQIAAQLFKVDETAISLGRSGAKWLTVAIPHRAEGLTFRGNSWFDVLEGALKYLIACVVTNPEGAAQAAAAAKLDN